MELYLKDIHHSFHFSAYRDWYHPGRMTVLPHPWINHSRPDRDRLVWRDKPPLRAGFMGSVYGSSAVVRIARNLPSFARQRLLRGGYLRHSRWLARAYAARLPIKFALAFPRSESLEALVKQADFPVDVIDTGGFTGQQDARDRYVEAMLASTYVICPRGSENFSYRAYEALFFGRVPVIIDTHMVLPDAVPWREVGIVVPYEDLDRIADMIREDYEGHSAAQFRERQELGLKVMDELAQGHWLDRALQRVIWPGDGHGNSAE